MQAPTHLLTMPFTGHEPHWHIMFDVKAATTACLSDMTSVGEVALVVMLGRFDAMRGWRGRPPATPLHDEASSVAM